MSEINVAEELKRKLNEIYTKYLEITRKEEKMLKVKEVAEELKNADIIRYTSVSWNPKKQYANLSDGVNDEINKMINEIAEFLGLNVSWVHVRIEYPCQEHSEETIQTLIPLKIWIGKNEEEYVEWLRIDNMQLCVRLLSTLSKDP